MNTERTGLADQLQENYLTCKICFNIYQQPKALPCLHTFCLGCLVSLIQTHQKTTQNRNSFQCPLCRKDVAIAADGARGFSDNHILVSLCDTLNIKQDGEVCKDNTELETSSGGKEIYSQTTSTNQPVVPNAPHDDSNSTVTSGSRISMLNPATTKNGVHAIPGFIRSFGQFGHSIIDMTEPIGLTTTSFGYVVVSDQRDNRILVYDILGNFCNQFQCEENVRTITAGDDEDSIIIAVSSSGQALAHRYNLKGTKEQSFGKMFGLEHPQGIAYTINAGVVVSTDSCVIYILNSNGKLVQKFGIKGNDITKIKTPYHMAINPKGDILVSDSECHAIKVFSRVGEFLFHFGGSYSNSQELCHPKGLCVDSNGNIIVADFGNHCVKRFSPTGSLMGTLIEFPSVQGSNQLKPINVALYENKVVVLVVGVYSAQVIVCDYQQLQVQSNKSRSKICSII